MADASREKKLKGADAADELRASESISRPVAEYLAALDAALPPDPDEPAPVDPTSISPTDPEAALTCKHGPARLIDRNITPYIPVIDRTRQQDAFFTRDAFRYDQEADAYRCPADKLLGYCAPDRTKQVRVYRSRPADCAACELKPQCTIGTKRGVTGSSARKPAIPCAPLPAPTPMCTNGAEDSGLSACSAT